MKKFILILSLLISNMALASDIGYIDYDVLFNNIQTSIDLKTEIDAKVDEINSYNKETEELLIPLKNREAKNRLILQREPELKKLEAQYQELKFKRNIIVRAKIKAAAETVLNRKKLDIIIDKKSYVAGGIDCTQEVLEAVK